MRDKKALLQHYTDILPESSEQEDATLLQLVHDLDTVYTAPRPPESLTWSSLRMQHVRQTFNKRTPSFVPMGSAMFPSFFLKKRVLLPTLLLVVLAVSAFTVFSPLLSSIIPIYPSTQGLIDAKLFTDIHQSQTVGNFTVTVDEGYIDANAVIIGYTITPINPKAVPADTRVVATQFSLTAQQGLDLLSNADLGMAFNVPQSSSVSSENTMEFDINHVAGNPTQLDLQLKLGIVGQHVKTHKTINTATMHNVMSNGSPVLGWATYHFSLPFHGGTTVTPQQSVTTDGQTATLESVAIARSCTRIVMKGLGKLEPIIGHGFSVQLQVPGSVKALDYETFVLRHSDGTWSFFYPYDLSGKHGTWKLTLSANHHTLVFTFDVP